MLRQARHGVQVGAGEVAPVNALARRYDDTHNNQLGAIELTYRGKQNSPVTKRCRLSVACSSLLARASARDHSSCTMASTAAFGGSEIAVAGEGSKVVADMVSVSCRARPAGLSAAASWPWSHAAFLQTEPVPPKVSIPADGRRYLAPRPSSAGVNRRVLSDAWALARCWMRTSPHARGSDRLVACSDPAWLSEAAPAGR